MCAHHNLVWQARAAAAFGGGLDHPLTLIRQAHTGAISRRSRLTPLVRELLTHPPPPRPWSQPNRAVPTVSNRSAGTKLNLARFTLPPPDQLSSAASGMNSPDRNSKPANSRPCSSSTTTSWFACRRAILHDCGYHVVEAAIQTEGHYDPAEHQPQSMSFERDRHTWINERLWLRAMGCPLGPN
jgi:hypothetical protein